jgi:hypothetical protein
MCQARVVLSGLDREEVKLAELVHMKIEDGGA